MYKRGYEVSREEKKKQDKRQKEMGKKLWRFMIMDDGEEADVHFLTETPVNFDEHTIKTFRKGTEHYDKYTCTGDDCPLCAEGDKPSFKGAFLVVDHREFEYTDAKGKKQTGTDRIRLLVMGTKVVSQLDRISSKYGLRNRIITIVRSGKGNKTDYIVEKGDKEKLTAKEIENLLPDAIKEMYDGTDESLYAIIEDQLSMCVPEKEDDDDEEEEKPSRKSRATRSRRHDEDEDEDEDEDDDDEKIMGVDDDEEEEEERPKRKLSTKKKTMFRKK